MEDSSNKIVSAIVVTRGVDNYVWLCLDSIKKQTNPIFEVIVINNSLSQDLSQEINRRYPDIKLYSSSSNLFYCESINKGVEISKGDFILCINDDVILDKRFIEEALKVFFLDTKIGMVSGKVLRFDKQTIDSTGLFLTPWRTAKERGYGTKDKGRFDKEEYIFGVNGAVAFYRKDMLDDIKLGQGDYFDADYHIFYEDLDIAWRAQNIGWKAYYAPRAIAYHARGATVRLISGIGKPYARRYLADNLHFDLVKNRYITIIKNESVFSFIMHLPFILCYDFLAWAYIIFSNPRIIKFFLNTKILKSSLEKRRLIKEKRLKL
jgi:GT2 family glycosyltransferase